MDLIGGHAGIQAIRGDQSALCNLSLDRAWFDDDLDPEVRDLATSLTASRANFEPAYAP